MLPATTPFTAIARARVSAGGHDETVEVGPIRPETILRRVRDDARLRTTAAVARRLVPRATTLRAHALGSETRAVQRVGLRCGVAQELVDAGSGLRLVEPAGYETDGSIGHLVDGILKGKALAWVADTDDGTFGFTPDGCRVVLSFVDGNAPLTVRFGSPGEGGVHAMIEGRPEVFVAPASLHALAGRIYVSHATLRVDPATIDAVQVLHEGRAVSGRSAAALREAAGHLVADRALAVGTSDVGKVDVEITITTEAGPRSQRKIRCGRMAEGETWRRCAMAGVKAVFAVRPPAVAAFLEPVRDGRDGRDVPDVRDGGRD